MKDIDYTDKQVLHAVFKLLEGHLHPSREKRVKAVPEVAMELSDDVTYNQNSRYHGNCEMWKPLMNVTQCPK